MQSTRGTEGGCGREDASSGIPSEGERASSLTGPCSPGDGTNPSTTARRECRQVGEEIRGAAIQDPVPKGAEAVTTRGPGAAACSLLPRGALVARGPEENRRERKRICGSQSPSARKRPQGPNPRRPGDSPRAARGPRGGRLRTYRRPRRGPGCEWGRGGAGSSPPGRGVFGKVGWGRGRAEPNS